VIERGGPAFDHPPMNFSELEIGIYFSVDANEIFFAAQEVEEGTKI
jgi:hypothetical protein